MPYQATAIVNGTAQEWPFVTYQTELEVRRHLAACKRATLKHGGQNTGTTYGAITPSGDRYEFEIARVARPDMRVLLGRYLDGHPADIPNGLCTECGGEDWECEPDARGYQCDNCEGRAVTGFMLLSVTYYPAP